MSVLAGSLTPEQDKRTFFTAQVLFWMLCAPDGHAKNFSLFIRPGRRFQHAPLYDVISVYPILGNGPNQISPFKVKLAMAVDARHGVVTASGPPVEHLLDDLVACRPEVITQVRRQLPDEFPKALANSILDGLTLATERLRA